MSNGRTLVTMASWEERFVRGVERSAEAFRPDRIIMLFIDRYADRTRMHREQICAYGKQNGLEVTPVCLLAEDHCGNWRVLAAQFPPTGEPGNRIMVDITTMPREVIWELFWIADNARYHTEYVYHRPKSYSAAWLSRDPQRPRLVFKLSGESMLGARSALVVLAGYDPERTMYLRNFFEPGITLLGLQAGGGDSSNDRRMEEHAERFRDEPDVLTFGLDAYSSDHGQAAIESQLGPYLQSHNIIMSSLGPKPTAVALYRIHRRWPAIGLAYAPSNEFNEEYSSGIAGQISGVL